MQIKQFEDENLSHYSYAVISDCEMKMIVIDPARDASLYLNFAKEKNVEIVGVIETHPHADFVSSHLELHKKTGATIYASKLTEASYPHQPFDDGDKIELGKIRLEAINTPGHSPDSICVYLYHKNEPKALFTGDTLFIGDCGRPDLREDNKNVELQKKNLAKKMYHSLHHTLKVVKDSVIIYPAHGAGTLCGKSLSDANSSTMGKERQENWSLQPMSEDEFVENLLADQPFVPAYFPYNVALNKEGAPDIDAAINAVKVTGTLDSQQDYEKLDKNIWIVDTRDEKEYKKGHIKHSVNIMGSGKFDTWLGSLIKPDEVFYLAAADEETLQRLIKRTAAIGYESKIKEAFVLHYSNEDMEEIDVSEFEKHKDNYTIIDVRNESELKEGKVFQNSLSIPLPELGEKSSEIPTNKPIVVHCASGFRSAAASSLLQSKLNGKAQVFDLSEAVKGFMKK